MKWKVPLFDLRLTAADRRSVGEALKSDWITVGPATARFERAVAALVRAPHAIAVSSGTAALHIAYSALGLGPGDEVLCPALTFVATANAIAMTGAKPVFVDVQSESRLQVSCEDLAAKITPRTRALAIVDYAGQPADIAPVASLLKNRGIRVVEDAAHAIGGSLHGRMCGILGDVGCFSFYSNKNITTAEGGAIVTADPEIARRARLMRSHGMTSLSHDRLKGHAFDYDVLMTGYNYRLDDLRAALGVSQLATLRERQKQRERLVRLYTKRLAKVPGVIVPEAGAGAKSAFHIMPIVLPEGTDRMRVMTLLKRRGIQTSIHYRPIPTFSYYRERYGEPQRLPVLDRVAPRLLTLPLYPHLKATQVEYVVESLGDALE